MTDESADKKHDATSRHLEQLKKQGQILRSKDFTGGLIFIITMIAMVIFGKNEYVLLKKNFITSFQSVNDLHNLDQNMQLILVHVAKSSFIGTMPILIAALCAAMISPFLFGGWNTTLQAIEFKWSALNPINNLKKIFSKKVLFSIFKSAASFIIIFGCFLVFIFYKKNMILQYATRATDYHSYELFIFIKSYLMILTFAIVLIIFIDIIYNYFDFRKNSRMTAQQLKDESKDTEGNIDIKRKVRQLQFALAKNRLSVTVPTATVIITNPTHYAVAIRYLHGNDAAPILVAKGQDMTAKAIREIAISHIIPIYESPVLARSIYHTTKVGTEINPGHYIAVAIVLNYVAQLKNYQIGKAALPVMVNDLQIPENLLF